MTNYEKILKKLQRKLASLITTMVNSGASEQDIIRASRKLISDFNPYKRLSERFLADADDLLTQVFNDTKKKITWVELANRPKPSKKALKTLLVANNQFALAQEVINVRVVDAVKKAIKQDLTTKELTDLVEKAVSGGRYQADTIANTALQGYSAANRIDMEREAGVKFWKYSGVPPERHFCQEHLGKEYSYEEIQAMDNGHGLPVLYYAGGWNCPHYWQAVITPDLFNKNGAGK